MESSIFDNTKEDQALGIKLLESHRFWSKKRLLFNIVVGLAGLISVITFLGNSITVFDLFGIIMWGIVANALYSIGYVWDSYIISKSKGERSLSNNRDSLFWLGTIAYVIVSILFTLMYSLNTHV